MQICEEPPLEVRSVYAMHLYRMELFNFVTFILNKTKKKVNMHKLFIVYFKAKDLLKKLE